MMIISGSAAAAECIDPLSNPRAQKQFAFSEGFLTHDVGSAVGLWRISHGNPLPQPRVYSGYYPAERLWREEATRLGAPASSAYGFNQELALKVLEERENQLGLAHPYLRLLAANQAAILNTDPNLSFKLPPAYGDAADDLARYDLAYQRAARAYHTRNQEESARAQFAAISQSPSPYRALAAYMVARIAHDQGDAAGARALTDAILGAPDMAEAHAIARELQNVLAYETLDDDLLDRQLVEAVDVALNMPASAMRDRVKIRQFDQAVRDIEYFVQTDYGFDWLRNPEIAPPTERAQALKRKAATDDAYIWLQAVVGGNPGDRAGIAYALERQDLTGDPVWLLAGFENLASDDPVADILLQRALSLRQKIMACAATDADYAVYGVLLPQIVWLQAVHGRVDWVHQLLREQIAGPRSLWGDASWQMLAWLTSTGQFEAARVLAKDIPPNGDGTMRQALATTLDGFLAANPNIGGDGLPMLELLPAHTLLSLAQRQDIASSARAALARVAWTRAFLLSDSDLLETATPLLLSLNPTIDPALKTGWLSWFDGGAEFQRARAALGTPRLTIDFRASRASGAVPALDEIDTYFHDENNWWCRYRPAEGRARAHSLIGYALTANPWGRADRHLSDEDQALMDARGEALWQDHPVVKLSDTAELDRLSQRPNGPEFLSKIAIERARTITWFDRLLGRDRDVPEALAQAVRSTRYGCQQDGGHGDYSRAAFRLLHSRYPDSPATGFTPYWFNAAHFRQVD